MGAGLEKVSGEAVRSWQLETFFEVSLDMLCIRDSHGRFVKANGAWETTLGYGPEDLEGVHMLSLIHPDDVGSTQQQMKEIHRPDRGVVGDFINRYRHKDGSYRHLEWRARVADGLVFGIARDVTERIRAEEERLQLEEKLRRSQRLEAVGQLTGGMAHDFNNLLTVILGSSEVLSEALVADPRKKAIAGMIVEAAERGAALTQRMLAFARQQALDPKAVDVNALVTGVEPLLRRTLGEHIDIVLRLEADLAPVVIDPAQLENAILNLCINARDAMPDGGNLGITTTMAEIRPDAHNPDAEVRPGCHVLLTVSDTGHGISPADLGRVFEPFFTTKEVGKGTGLGLPMVYGFIKQSGGHINIVSAPGVGTNVELYLPLADGEPEAVLPRAEDQPVNGGRETILLVEDDSWVREYARTELARLGYQVIEAAGGAQAMQILREGCEIDLLFTDVVMPGMSGWRLAQQARALRPDLRVLFTSGYNEDGVGGQKGLDAATLLLPKPYRRRLLARRIREALD